MVQNFELTKEWALEKDRNNEFKAIQEQFYIDNNPLYFDGNSLGLLSRKAEESIQRILNEWKTLGINGWFKGAIPWFYFAETLGKRCAPLVGAKPEEVVLTGTTTINIHSLIATFYEPKGSKTKILVDELNFPTDIYAVRNQIELRGLDPEENLVFVKSKDGKVIHEEDIIEAMTDDIALIFLPTVFYRTGQLLDVELLTKEAHKRGITIGFDASHSIGILPHYFDQWDVDFATWCSYKYLNGGPGSSAFIYVNQKHFTKTPKIVGWFGYIKDEQFDFKLDFNHNRTAGGWQISSPCILGSASLDGSLSLFEHTSIEKIREKSLELTNYLLFLVDSILIPLGFSVSTPRKDNKRGGHIALEHDKARNIVDRLNEQKMVTDYRPPNVIRIAPNPLYNTFSDLWILINKIKEITESM